MDLESHFEDNLSIKTTATFDTSRPWWLPPGLLQRIFLVWIAWHSSVWGPPTRQARDRLWTYISSSEVDIPRTGLQTSSKEKSDYNRLEIKIFGRMITRRKGLSVRIPIKNMYYSDEVEYSQHLLMYFVLVY